MRLFGLVRPRRFRRTEQRLQAHAETSKGVGSALFPVDDANGRAALQGQLPAVPGRHLPRAAGCDHVLDEADTLSFLVTRPRSGWRSRTPSPRLRTIRNGRPEASEAAAASATAPSSGHGEPLRVRLELGRRPRRSAAERLEQLGPRLEAVLVEVVGRALAGAQDEVALEVRDARGAPRRARRRSLRARGREMRRASGSSGRSVGRAVVERDDRAVLEVDVDPLACACANAPAEDDRCRRASRAERGAGQQLTPAIASSFFAAASGAASASPRRPSAAGSSSGRRRRARRSAPVRWSRRSSARRRGRGRRCPRPSPPRAGPAHRPPAAAGRFEQLAAPPSRTSSAAPAARASRRWAPLASSTTAASICDEISVRSARPARRPSALDATTVHTPSCETIREVLRRPRHAPRGDDRVLRAALVRAARLPLALAARLLGPGRRVELLRHGAAERASRACRSTASSRIVHAVQDHATDARDRRRRRSCSGRRSRSSACSSRRSTSSTTGRTGRSCTGRPARSSSCSRSLVDLFVGLLVGASARTSSTATRPAFLANAVVAYTVSVARLDDRGLHLPRLALPLPDERQRSTFTGRAARARSSATIVLEASFQVLPHLPPARRRNAAVRPFGGPDATC